MNEEQKQEKTGLDESRKNALMRYIAVLFAVAFLLVLFSLLGQMKKTNHTISELNQSSAGRVQQLQEQNQLLMEEKYQLEQQLQEQEEELEDLRKQLDELSEETIPALEKEKAELEATLVETSKISQAYEELMLVMELSKQGKPEGNVSFSKAMENLNQLKDYLGPRGLEEYENLTKEEE